MRNYKGNYIDNEKHGDKIEYETSKMIMNMDNYEPNYIYLKKYGGMLLQDSDYALILILSYDLYYLDAIDFDYVDPKLVREQLEDMEDMD